MQLQETTFCESLQPDQIDREAGVIRRVRLLGNESRNGPRGGKRIYSEAAMRKAAKLYEGRKVYIDHPDRKNPTAERKFGDFAGELKTTSYDPTANAVFGDFWVLKSHQLSESIFESAERFPNNFGFSHNANGKARRDGVNELVEDLHDVISCDVVTQPATSKGLFESESESKTVTKTIQQILESVDAKTPGHAELKALVEMDGDMGPLPVEMAEDATPNADEEIKAAFRSAVMAAFDDDSLDTKATVDKIKKILKAHDSVKDDPKEPTDSKTGDKSDDKTNSDDPPSEDDEMKESLQKMQDRLDRSECKTLLLESGRDAKEEWVDALAAMPEGEKRNKLLESLPTKESQRKGGQKPNQSKPLRESAGGDEIQSRWNDRVKRATERLAAR